jgi:hypothetical protein
MVFYRVEQTFRANCAPCGRRLFRANARPAGVEQIFRAKAIEPSRWVDTVCYAARETPTIDVSTDGVSRTRGKIKRPYGEGLTDDFGDGSYDETRTTR